MRLTSRKSNRETKLELSMTSMIDVVFLLLIFFMTTASFVKTEREIDSAIQVQKSGGRSTLEPTVVEVVRGAGGDYVYRLGTREFTDQAELTAILQQLDNKDQGAFVHVSDGAPFDMAAAAVQSCKTARFLSVSYVPIK